MARFQNVRRIGSLMAGAGVALAVTLWLVTALGRVWRTGGALAVLGLYLMMVLGLMAGLQVWAWCRDLRLERRLPPKVTVPPDERSEQPAMSAAEPLRDPDSFTLRQPDHPLATHLRLSRRFRREPPRPRRRV